MLQEHSKMCKRLLKHGLPPIIFPALPVIKQRPGHIQQFINIVILPIRNTETQVFHDDFLGLLEESVVGDQLGGVEEFEVVDESIDSLDVAAEHAEDLLLFLDFAGLDNAADGQEEEVKITGFESVLHTLLEEFNAILGGLPIANP